MILDFQRPRPDLGSVQFNTPSIEGSLFINLEIPETLLAIPTCVGLGLGLAEGLPSTAPLPFYLFRRLDVCRDDMVYAVWPSIAY